MSSLTVTRVHYKQNELLTKEFAVFDNGNATIKRFLSQLIYSALNISLERCVFLIYYKSQN